MSESNNPFTHGNVLDTEVIRPKYRAQPAKIRGTKEYVMSRTELMRFNSCPSRWMEGYGSDETEEMRWGSLVDCLALMPDAFLTLFAITPETYPAKGPNKATPTVDKPWAPQASFCQEWKAEQEILGKAIVKQKELFKAQDAVARLHKDGQISKLLRASKKSVLVQAFYKDTATKLVIEVNCLLDVVPHVANADYGKMLVDLKTTMNAGQAAWRKHVCYQGYDVQAAMYLDAYNIATGEDRLEFAHIVQESFRPYQTGRRILTSEFLELGRMKYRRALERYCKCVATGQWPDYDDESTNSVRGWSMVRPDDWMINATLDEP